MNWLAPLSIAQTAALAFLGFCVLDLAAKVENREQIAAQRVNDVTSPGAIAQAYFPAETVSAADIRSIVREEFAALSTATANGAPSPSRMAAAQPPANPSFQGQVRQQLKTHISRGSMSNADVDNFLAMTAELPADERTQMLRELTAAINSGRLEARF